MANPIVITNADESNTIQAGSAWVDAVHWTGAAATSDLVLSDIDGNILYKAVSDGTDQPLVYQVRARGGIVATTVDAGTALIYLRERE